MASVASRNSVSVDKSKSITLKIDCTFESGKVGKPACRSLGFAYTFSLFQSSILQSSIFLSTLLFGKGEKMTRLKPEKSALPLRAVSILLHILIANIVFATFIVNSLAQEANEEGAL